jgi:hypothetical protein
MPSLELNMIDNLTQSTTCSHVVMVRGSYRMEVEKRLVYPHQTLLEDIQINASAYAVVKVDMVYKNAKQMKREVPLDNMMVTLWDAINRRVKWRRTSIDIDPSAVALVSTTTRCLHTAHVSIFPKTQPNKM